MLFFRFVYNLHCSGLVNKCNDLLQYCDFEVNVRQPRLEPYNPFPNRFFCFCRVSRLRWRSRILIERLLKVTCCLVCEHMLCIFPLNALLTDWVRPGYEWPLSFVEEKLFYQGDGGVVAIFFIYLEFSPLYHQISSKKWIGLFLLAIMFV